MKQRYTIMDKNGKIIREGNFTEPEIRMVAKAGYRVFEGTNNEITPMLTGLFSGDEGEELKGFH
jgi:hypothetical protein